MKLIFNLANQAAREVNHVFDYEKHYFHKEFQLEGRNHWPLQRWFRASFEVGSASSAAPHYTWRLTLHIKYTMKSLESIEGIGREISRRII